MDAVAGRRDARLGWVGLTSRDDDAHRKVEGAGEIEVALVVRGYGHDRTCAVIGEHVVGSPDGNAFAVDGVDRVAAEEDTGLLAFSRQAIDVGEATNLLNVGVE